MDIGYRQEIFIDARITSVCRLIAGEQKQHDAGCDDIY
jgi:hypothetical protein